ncbi:TetR/AcrR family transcriptional regulator [Peribacillus psychrosaccharolyticus]|uniref:TetR/AcrR family transcriptional regulator n=1 Tax=Peribacillus psychrosaccharolyticus TaxID=1407 RepID=A0A974NMS2_PERPY|nr:TetR/AcrR family transcriptional regulator [Peribacillus psychrosaccharolyticus]MEC2055973.1 TetR/AcrR family transcriptional regulator [Peribacillus psychrosaccharolyticus]MED3743147.1 TetR/AcrR family transcriptional regulator [Peribacillus psychrosaccharolyticus]QQT00816.1 TetR/AcrR family transcriptional regulator [Peribacillus psychrosaccharolyticus]
MGKREDILTATLDLITEEGLQSVTFSKIFKRANVGSSTFYHYYKSKEELVSELFLNARTHMSESVMIGYDPNRTVYERLKGILKSTADYALNYPKELSFIENYCQSPYISEELRNRLDPSAIEIFSIIEQGQKQGIIREMDIILCCQLVTGMINSVIQGYLAGKYPLDEYQIQQTLEACWKAIKV